MSAAYQQPTTADIADALGWISPDCEREHWVRILMAVKAALGDAGRDIAEAWSAGCDRYNGRDFRDTWRSIKEGGGITAATLFRLARDAGYRAGTAPPVRINLEAVVSRQKPEPQSSTFAYACTIWSAAGKPARRDDAYVASHPYAIRKGIHHAAGAGRTTASGRLVGRDADCLVIPLRTLDGEFVGVECINAEGKKQTFGSKGVLILGNDLDRTLPQLVCEGWACGVGLFLQYRGNVAVYCAFSKDRLMRVAEQVAARYRDREIIVCREADA